MPAKAALSSTHSCPAVIFATCWFNRRSSCPSNKLFRSSKRNCVFGAIPRTITECRSPTRSCCTYCSAVPSSLSACEITLKTCAGLATSKIPTLDAASLGLIVIRSSLHSFTNVPTAGDNLNFELEFPNADVMPSIFDRQVSKMTHGKEQVFFAASNCFCN